MARFNLNSLVALDALLRHQTLTGAAQSINLSQPAMSIALKRLRETFGDELVRYDRGRTVYTALAEEMRPKIVDIVERSSDLIKMARQFDPQSLHGTITICAPQSTLSFFYAQIVAALAIKAPRLSVRCLIYPPAPSAVDGIDLFIVPEWLAAPQAPHHVLFTEQFNCLMPPDHDGIDQVGADIYMTHGHAALPPGEEEVFWAPGSSARDLLACRTIRARAAQWEALRFLVVRNGLIATMPSRMAQHCGAMSTALPVGAPRALDPVTLVVQAPPHRTGEKALRWLMDEMVGIAEPFGPRPSSLAN